MQKIRIFLCKNQTNWNKPPKSRYVNILTWRCYFYSFEELPWIGTFYGLTFIQITNLMPSGHSTSGPFASGPLIRIPHKILCYCSKQSWFTCLTIFTFTPFQAFFTYFPIFWCMLNFVLLGAACISDCSAGGKSTKECMVKKSASSTYFHVGTLWLSACFCWVILVEWKQAKGQKLINKHFSNYMHNLILYTETIPM